MNPDLLQHGIRRVAEQRISEAQQKGAFNNLPGHGKPIPNLDEPYDEMWWVRRWIRREKLDPVSIQHELRNIHSPNPKR